MWTGQVAFVCEADTYGYGYAHSFRVSSHATSIFALWQTFLTFLLQSKSRLKGFLDHTFAVRRPVPETTRSVSPSTSSAAPASASRFSVLGAPKAIYSVPSGPTSKPRVVPADTRIASHGSSSITSLSSLIFALPSTST